MKSKTHKSTVTKIPPDDSIKYILLFDSMPDYGVVRLEVVMSVLGVSRSTILRACENGTFPKPIKMHGNENVAKRTNLWKVSEVKSYLKNLSN